MITIHGLKQSRALRATWACEELGLVYTFRALDAMKGELRSPDFLALNPGGKVPTLVEDDFVLTESGAIVAYLADKRPDVGLMPAAGTPERAKCWQWMLFALTELEQPLWTISKHTFALPEKLRVPAIIPTAKKEFLRAAGVLATGLGDREWLGGDAFTGADLMVGHTLAWARAFSVPWEQPTLDAYAERVLSRPALARASAKEQAA
ncbi:MAG: glutathione S-transferase family protein [Myxococcales bacterium]|nr:glutathione S-transferase family protein [Myxococcales bacterium]